MKLEDLASTVEKKIQLLENADAQAIKVAEAAYAASNAALKEQIEVLKKDLINLELLSGSKFNQFNWMFRSTMLNPPNRCA